MQLTALFRYLRTRLVNLNLFENAATQTDLNLLRMNIIATRLYVVLLTSAVFSLALFTILGQQTRTITIRHPSQDVFQDLGSKYATAPHCPCSQPEITHNTYINITYKFHPVCSSVFVSDRWINLLFSPDMTYYFPLDFRSSASGQFQLLAALCALANRTLQNAVEDFLADALLSPQALSIGSLQSQTEAANDFLKTSTIYTFRRQLNLVLETTRSNGLLPAMQTAKMQLIYVYPNNSIDAYPYETIWEGDDNGECFCGITSNCYAPSRFFDMYAEETEGAFEPPSTFLGTVDGFFVGCYALEALLKSTLTCLFGTTCLSNLLTFFPSTGDITDFVALKAEQTGYAPDTTIATLSNSLFLEQWSAETSFSDYYTKCAPILCTYQFTERNNFLQVLTTLLGVYGGLTLVLRMCIVTLVHFWRNRLRSNRTESNTTTRGQRFRNAYGTAKVWIINLNLFKTSKARTDPFELGTTRIITRVYLFTVLIALSIISIYLLSSVRVYTVTEQNPSRALFENLHKEYTSSLTCPCNHIANTYKSFASLSPVYHPVCSSLFVSEKWIVAISTLNIIDSDYDPIDFRVAGPTFFNTLATLCSLSQATIADAWYSFGRLSLITDLATSEADFQARVTTVIERFKKTTISEFQRILTLVDLHAKTMYTSGYDNIVLYTDQLTTSTTPIDFQWMPQQTETCWCGLHNNCTDVMSFFHYTSLDMTTPYFLNFTLPDIPIGCFVVSSVLESSLSCFFNQTCLDMVQEEVKSQRSIVVPTLNTSSTRFPPQALIKTMLDSLMIEVWNDKIDHGKYYEQCAPAECTYSYTDRNNPIQTITTLVGLFGGLSIALKIIVSLIVRQIRNRMRPHKDQINVPEQPATIQRVLQILRALKNKLLQLNLFDSELSWDDPQRRTREMITTRLYLLLLMTAVVILVIYTFIDTQRRIVKVLNPSQEQFDQLRSHSQYSATLDCPCENILVPYQSFISVRPSYHQLCSSDFVASNSSWIFLLYSPSASIDYPYDDYRLFVVPHFQLLASLCTLANATVTEAIGQFSRNTITNERVQSRETIELQTTAILARFGASTPRTFVLSLDFIRYMSQGNGIVSSILSNWHFVTLNTNLKWAVLWALPRSYAAGNCTCGTSSMCISPATFNGSVIPGFHVGCYPLESLLESTLECLYNTTCIGQLKTLYGSSTMTFSPLNSALSAPNATVQTLLKALLVESWQTSVVYDQYFAACAPLWCTYTYDGQISPIYTVTIIIGLYGGLTIALKLITPFIVQVGYRIIRYHRQRTASVLPLPAIETINVF